MRNFQFALCFLGVAAVATPAVAEETLLSALTAPSAARNQWFGDVSSSVRVQEIPEIDLFYNDVTTGPGTTLDPQIVMGGGSLTLGHVFGKQLDPQIWGGRPHVAVSAHYFVGSDDESFSAEAPGGDLFFIDLDGDPIDLTNLGPVVFGSARTHLADWGGELRGGLDFDQGNGWVLTPSISFFGSHSELSQTITFYRDALFYANQLDTEVRNTRWGSAFGLGATNDLGGGFLLLMGVELGLDYNMTKADLTSCLSATNPPCSGSIDLYEQASLEDNHFGFFANAALGVAFNIGFAQIAIEGQGGYDSYIPTIDYGNAPGEVTQIGDEGDFNFGGGVTVTIPIN